MSDDLIRLFVYGTLRVNRPNYPAIARHVIDVEPATVQGILVDLGSFPALIPGPGIVQGELLALWSPALRITDRIEGVAHGFNVSRTAELLPMDVGHFRRLIKRGVFPSPKRTGKGKAFYDYELLVEIASVLKAGIGRNGEEIAFYRRKPKRPSQRTAAAKREQQPAADDYVNAVVEGCRQLGIADADLEPTKISAILAAEFKDERPSLEQAIPVVARRLLEAQG